MRKLQVLTQLTALYLFSRDFVEDRHSRLWINWAGYRRWAAWDAWAGVIKLTMAAVCDRVRLAIGPVSGVLFTVGGSWSTVWGNLDLVCCATGS